MIVSGPVTQKMVVGRPPPILFSTGGMFWANCLRWTAVSRSDAELPADTDFLTGNG